MIAAGFSFIVAGSRHDVVVVGRGDRTHVDELVRRAPADVRSVVLDYFKPMVEGGYPARAGAYVGHPGRASKWADAVILWYKHCHAVLS